MNGVREMPPWCWLIQFVYAMERDWRRDGRSMVADYGTDLKVHEREAASAPDNAYGRYLKARLNFTRQALGLLVGRRGVFTYQTGLRA